MIPGCLETFGNVVRGSFLVLICSCRLAGCGKSFACMMRYNLTGVAADVVCMLGVSPAQPLISSNERVIASVVAWVPLHHANLSSEQLTLEGGQCGHGWVSKKCNLLLPLQICYQGSSD